MSQQTAKSAVYDDVHSSSIVEPVGALNYTMRCPVGVAGLITPWNLPLYLLTFKVAPAIAAGNTVVVKPSEMTSVSAWALCKVFKDAGNFGKLPNSHMVQEDNFYL